MTARFQFNLNKRVQKTTNGLSAKVNGTEIKNWTVLRGESRPRIEVDRPKKCGRPKKHRLSTFARPSTFTHFEPSTLGLFL